MEANQACFCVAVRAGVAWLALSHSFASITARKFDEDTFVFPVDSGEKPDLSAVISTVPAQGYEGDDGEVVKLAFHPIGAVTVMSKVRVVVLLFRKKRVVWSRVTEGSAEGFGVALTLGVGVAADFLVPLRAMRGTAPMRMRKMTAPAMIIMSRFFWASPGESLSWGRIGGVLGGVAAPVGGGEDSGRDSLVAISSIIQAKLIKTIVRTPFGFTLCTLK